MPGALIGKKITLAGRARIVLTFAARSSQRLGNERLANVLSTNYFRHTDENPLL